MVLALIDAIRYFISGLLCFDLFNSKKSSKLKNVFIPSVVYTVLLVAFKLLVIDSPIITLVSVLIVFTYLVFENNFKMVRLDFAYPFFVICLLECIHILLFMIVSITRSVLGLPEVTSKNHVGLAIFRAVVVLLYAIAIYFIHKSYCVNLDLISKISRQRFVMSLLVFGLGVLIYLKYYIRNADTDKLHSVVSVVFIIFLIMFFAFLVSIKNFLKVIDKLRAQDLNPAIEEAKMNKGKRYAGMKFASSELNLEMECFKNSLDCIGMDTQDRESMQIAFALVLLKHEKNPKAISLRSEIYSYIADILDIQVNTVESNIANALKRHWTIADAKTLEKINENYKGPISEKNGAPTPKEFLIYMIESQSGKNSTT